MLWRAEPHDRFNAVCHNFGIRPTSEKANRWAICCSFHHITHTHTHNMSIDVGSIQRPYGSTSISGNDSFCLYYYYLEIGYVRRCYTNPISQPRTSRLALLTTRRRSQQTCSSRHSIRIFPSASCRKGRRVLATSSCDWSVGGLIHCRHDPHTL